MEHLVDGNLTREQVVSEYKEVFKGEGQFSDVLHLQVDPNVPSVQLPPRKPPIAFKTNYSCDLFRGDVFAPTSCPTFLTLGSGCSARSPHKVFEVGEPSSEAALGLGKTLTSSFVSASAGEVDNSISPGGTFIKTSATAWYVGEVSGVSLLETTSREVVNNCEFC